MVLRLGKAEIDFLFFHKESDGIQVSSWGSEPIEHLSTRQVLEKILMQLPRGQVIEELVVTFHASQFQAQVVRETFSSHTPSARIGASEAKAIERDACARVMRASQKSLFAESGILPNEFSVRRVNVLERKIDGYTVRQLEGYKKGEIELSILVVFLLESSFLAVEEFAKAHKILSKLRVIHSVEAMESFAKEHKQSEVFIYTEEEKTQVAVLHGDHFAFPGSIPIGADNFTEIVANTLGMRESAAEQFQAQYFRGDLSVATQEKVQHYLLPEVRKFVTLIQRKLEETKMMLPESVRIFGEARVLREGQNSFFQSALEDLPFVQKPKVSFLLPSEVWEAKSFAGDDDPHYTILCLLGALALNSK